MLVPGSTIAHYRIEAEIGSGSTSIVYLVRRVAGRQRYALKVLTLRHPEVFQRMQREAELMATLDHPNIVRFVELIDVDGRPGLVMEWVQGPSLQHWLDANPDASLDVRDAIAERVVHAMAYAHGRGLVHRDLKPENVLMEVRGPGVPVPRITDFGLAKVIDSQQPSYTQTGHALGTPRYMAPEQIRSAKHVDARADVFSLGCVLYELYCRRVTFPQPDVLSVYNAILDGDFEDPGRYFTVPTVVGAIRDALSVEPEGRPADAHELKERIWPASEARTALFEHSLTSIPVARTPEPEWWQGWAAIGLGGVMGALFAGIVLLGFVVVLWWLAPG